MHTSCISFDGKFSEDFEFEVIRGQKRSCEVIWGHGSLKWWSRCWNRNKCERALSSLLFIGSDARKIYHVTFYYLILSTVNAFMSSNASPMQCYECLIRTVSIVISRLCSATVPFFTIFIAGRAFSTTTIIPTCAPNIRSIFASPSGNWIVFNEGATFEQLKF